MRHDNSPALPLRCDVSPVLSLHRLLHRHLRGAVSAALELLFPRACCACDGPSDGAPFCAGCAAALTPLDPARACPRCAGPLDEALRCADCRRLGPLFSCAHAAFEYGAPGGPLAAALLRLKWQERDDLAGPLGALLGPLLAARAAEVDLLVPVPLHRARLRERGYNQAGLLAAAARRAAGVSLPMRHGLLERRGDAAPARDLGWRQRQQRAAAAFTASGRLRGERVLLLDDVMTTGATAQGCAAALLAAGAGSVEVLTLCRAAS